MDESLPPAVDQILTDVTVDQTPESSGNQSYLPLGGDGKPIRAQQVQCFVPYIHAPHTIEVGEYNFVRYIYECRGRAYIDGE